MKSSKILKIANSHHQTQIGFTNYVGYVDAYVRHLVVIHNCFTLQTLWKSRLTCKFQNRRKQESKSDDKLQVFRKRKTGSGSPASKSTEKAKQMWGVNNYLPQPPASEDERSMQRHKQWLIGEKNKRCPDIKRVDSAMINTLSILTIQQHQQRCVEVFSLKVLLAVAFLVLFSCSCAKMGINPGTHATCLHHQVIH